MSTIPYLIEICEGFLKNIGYSPNKDDIHKYLLEAIDHFNTPEYAMISMNERNKMIISRVRGSFEQRAQAQAQAQDDNALFFQKLDYLESQRNLPVALAPAISPPSIPAPTPDILMPMPAPAPAAVIINAAAPIIVNSADREWISQETARDIWTWNGNGNNTSSTICFIKIFKHNQNPGILTITGVGGQSQTIIFDENGYCIDKEIGLIKNLSLPWKIQIKGFNAPLNFKGTDGWTIRSVEINSYTFISINQIINLTQEFAIGDDCLIGGGANIIIKIIGINESSLIINGRIETPIVNKPILNLSRQIVLVFSGAFKN